MAALLSGLARALGAGRRVALLGASGLALLGLAGLSFGLSYLPLAGWALPLALLIAVIKAALVLGVFMELGHEAMSVRLAALASLLTLLVLVAFTVADVVLRERAPLSPTARSERGLHAVSPIRPTGDAP